MSGDDRRSGRPVAPPAARAGGGRVVTQAPPSSSSGVPSGRPFGSWPDDDTFTGTTKLPTRPRVRITPSVLVQERALTVPLRVLAGAEGLDRPIDHSRIQKSGLALAGHFHGIVPTRIQILGQTEQAYLNDLDPTQRRQCLAGFFGLGLSCVILTGQLGPSAAEMIAFGDGTRTPVLHAQERSSLTITALHALLDDRLAPRQRLHGVLVDVFGVGLLLMGSSGVGKSECALDLVMRGHRLVADDVVECDYRPPGMIFGAPAQLLRHLLEVRGLGVLNIKDLYGVTAIRERKRIDVVVRLQEEKATDVKSLEVDRLGLDDRSHDILSVSIPELVIPVRPGRDMASILEVAARNELLKNAGHHAGRELFGTIEASLRTQETNAHEAATPETRALRDPQPPSSEMGALPRRTTLPSEYELERAARVPIQPALVGRSDESAMPPPVGAMRLPHPPRKR